MNLLQNSIGPEVRKLQQWLNQVPPSSLPPLAEDAIFGPKTKARAQEFQSNSKLKPDGIVGPLTWAALELALKLLAKTGGTPAPVTAVKPINDYALGALGTDNLVLWPVPAIPIIAEASFQPGIETNELKFAVAPGTSCRLGIFVASKKSVQRVVFLMLPPAGKPDRVIICITHMFGQSPKVGPLGWADPLSLDLINYTLEAHLLSRWGAQVLASRRQMAVLYILRAKGPPELGPFANDGAFVYQVLSELVTLTNGAFSFETVEAFTFSSGIHDFNTFIAAVKNHLNIADVYSFDPFPVLAATRPGGAVRKEYLVYMNGGKKMGDFEGMGLPRWVNEPYYFDRYSMPALLGTADDWKFSYLHNHCAPKYLLYLAIQTS